MKFYYPVILLLSILFSSCNDHQQEKEELPQTFKKQVDLEMLDIQPEKISSLDSLLQTFIDEKKLNGLTAFVVQNGNVLYNKAFGFKNIENQLPATTDDYYVLFSQTKAITTVAFMTLVEKGLVAIDDPVSKYFPEISDQVVTKVNEDGTYETRQVETPMTFVHLMAHTSGLNAGLVSEIRKAERKRDSTQAESISSRPDRPMAGQRSFGGDPESRFLEEEMLDLAKYPLGFDPGSEWNYHISTNMLAYLIERITGKSLQEYIKETILDPLEMNETDWFYAEDVLPRFVKPYALTEEGLNPSSSMFAEAAVSEEKTYAEGAIGLNGPIEDYAKFCQMLLNKGKFNNHQILKPETIELMTEINRLPQENSGGKGFQFGLGFQLANEENKHIAAVSNTAYGWGGMYGTEYIIDPEHDLIALFYINMNKRDPLYPLFLDKVYALLDAPKN